MKYKQLTDKVKYKLIFYSTPDFQCVRWVESLTSPTLSMQYENIKHSQYGNLKKVYSIWIVFNAPKEEKGSITEGSVK